MYEVRVFNAKGKLTRIIPKDEVALAHWGAEKKCKGCGRFFNVVRKNKKKTKQEKVTNNQFVPDLVSAGEYCTPRCRTKTGNAKRKENGKVDYGEIICDICGKMVQRKTHSQIRHGGQCKKTANNTNNRNNERRRLAKLKEDRLENGKKQ